MMNPSSRRPLLRTSEDDPTAAAGAITDAGASSVDADVASHVSVNVKASPVAAPIVIEDDRPISEDGEEAPPTSAGPFHVGQVIAGTFEVMGILGVGGMGVVYDAFDQLLRRRVAIKVPSFAAYANALRSEAQALAVLHSPHFVTVHGLWEHDRTMFMVMERLYGETLDVRLEDLKAASVGAREPQYMPINDGLDLLIEIADALTTAHRAGIAQRDLKPSNVMLCGDRVVLIDLGLFVPEVLVGPENEAAGSADYIAPEVLLHEVKQGNGPLIDLYALGALAYHILTNAPPFTAETMGRLMLKHISTPPPDIRARRPEIPMELAFLVAELMAKDPASRPPSAEAVLWQLKNIRDVQTASSRAKPMTILAVDDEQHVGHALKRSLESAFPKLHVDTTTNPADAMTSLDPMHTDRSKHPDVVLVDLNMPAHNGIEVCMNLLSLPKAQRPIVVAMSAEAQKRDIEVLRAIGVKHFVPKDDSFVTAMSEVIGGLRANAMGIRSR